MNQKLLCSELKAIEGHLTQLECLGEALIRLWEKGKKMGLVGGEGKEKEDVGGGRWY